MVNYWVYESGFRYHNTAKVNWNREIRKLPKHCIWNQLSKHSNITWDIIQTNPDAPWNWYGISMNPNITWDIIQTNPNNPWNWDDISENPNITWDIIKAYRNKPWN